MGKWCRWFGAYVSIPGKAEGWLHVKRAGRGHNLSVWNPKRRKATFLTYVKKADAQNLFALPVENALGLALIRLERKFGIEPAVKETRIKTFGHARAKVVAHLDGGDVILYQRRSGSWALYIRYPNTRYWRYLTCVRARQVFEMLTSSVPAFDALPILEKKGITVQEPTPKSTSTSSWPEDSIGDWVLDRSEYGDIEAVRDYFDYNPNNALELYTEDELIEMGIFSPEEIKEAKRYW